MKPLLQITKSALFISICAMTFSCHLFNSDDILSKNSDSNDTISNTLTAPNSIADTANFPESKIDSTKQYIYLTFDDGPYKGSQKINKIIEEENAKATVYIVGLNAYTDEKKQFIEDYKKNPLIEVSNHTYTHARNKYTSYYSNPEKVLNDVKKNDTFYDIKNRFIRLPGRNVWRLGDFKKNDHDKGSINTANLLAENNYYIVGWDYEWTRSSKNHELDSPEKIYNGMVHRLNNKLTFQDKHLVILMHDDMFDDEINAEKLRALIKLIKNNKDMILEFTSKYPFKIS